jgi:hypothetical protein
MITGTGCGHRFGSVSDVSEANRAAWADEVARLAARESVTAGALSVRLSRLRH